MLTERQQELHDIWSRHIDQYVKRVVRPSLPNFRWKSASTLSPYDAIPGYAMIDASDSNEIFYGSGYYYNGDLSFIHYTNLKSLFSILNESSMRLYSLYGMSDPKEFEPVGQLFESYFKGSWIERYKQQLFVLSMYNLKLERGQKSLPMWKLYCDDGKGVAIVLKFSNRNRKHWLNTYLSKTYYKEKDYNWVKSFLARHQQFESEFDFHVGDPYKLFFPILGFHKFGIYKSETEIRLLKHIEVSPFETVSHPNIFRDVNRVGHPTFYTKVSLKKFQPARGLTVEQQRIQTSLFPVIKIEKIIFGYNIRGDLKDEIIESIRQMIKEKPEFKNMKFETTGLSKYFN